MRSNSTSALLLLAAYASGTASAAATKPTHTTTTAPCTASSTGGAFYDLRPDIAISLKEGDKAKHGVKSKDYLARGHDYGSNFTVNICDALVKPPSEAVGIDEKLLANVSAYYVAAGNTYSLGQQSSKLISRGRELVLQYSGGSPCPDTNEKRSTREGASYKYHFSDEEVDATTSKRTSASATMTSTSTSTSTSSSSTGRRKSATFAFLCDRDPLNTEATVSFVHTPDECAYFFKIRSQHACAGVEPHKPGSVGPGGVFAIILLVALLVYFIGGIVYQRTVANARGWRQLPNYTIWKGAWTFISDAFVILTSSCARCIPRRQGYRSLSSRPNGRSRDREDENRLIDSLDEEWED